MADRNKLIFVNADSDYEETASTDSIGPYNSYKTTNYELTDALLGKLVNAINVSTGAPDAGKFILTDAGGKIDGSFLDQTDVDHGSISGLADDDHLQYIRVDGTRAFTGNQSMGGFQINSLAAGTAGTDAVNLDQLQQFTSGLQDFRESVIDKDLLTPPGSPTTGDRYLVGQPTDTPTGAWATFAGRIVEWNGTAWVEDGDGTPDEGTYVFVEDEDSAYIFNNNVFASGQWTIFSTGLITASLGAKKVGNDIRADLLAAGGLKLVGNSIKVEPDDFAGTGLQDDGSDNMEIDFANTATEMSTSRAVAASDLSANGANQGAKILGFDPANCDLFTATNIQGAMDELCAAVEDGGGVLYTVGTGGVDKAHLVYVNANDTVVELPITGVNSSNHGIGLAKTTEIATATVEVVENDVVLTGVLTGATAGDKIFWTGTGLSSTAPSAGGSKVWRVGVAKNATDLHVDVEYIKKNA